MFSKAITNGGSLLVIFLLYDAQSLRHNKKIVAYANNVRNINNIKEFLYCQCFLPIICVKIHFFSVPLQNKSEKSKKWEILF